MLGLTDFNNISAFGLQEVFIIEGGNSALFGSGSVGGTIFLRNKIKYNQGVGSSLEVVSAETALKEAENNYIAALYNALIAKVELDKTYGK